MRVLVVNAGSRAEAVRRIIQRFPGLSIADNPTYVDEPIGPIDLRIEFTPRGVVIAPYPLDVSPVDFLWAHESRFAPSARAIKQSLDAGKLGAVGLLRIHDWRSGGGLQDRLAQQLDLACWLVGASPRIVSAQASGDDYMQAHLGFPGDAMAIVDCMTCLPGGSDGYRSLSVIGASGGAYADDHRNLHLKFAGDEPTASFAREDDAALLAAMSEFLKVLAHGAKPSCGAADWDRANTLLEAVRRSLAANEAINIGEVAT